MKPDKASDVRSAKHDVNVTDSCLGAAYETVAKNIKRKITSNMSGAHVEVADESHNHVGHLENTEVGASHVRVTVISKCFAGMSSLQRQRFLHKILQEEVKMLHSVSFTLKEFTETTRGAELKSQSEECTTPKIHVHPGRSSAF